MKKITAIMILVTMMMLTGCGQKAEPIRHFSAYEYVENFYGADLQGFEAKLASNGIAFEKTEDGYIYDENDKNVVDDIMYRRK